MKIRQYDIKDVCIDPTITIFLAQLDVQFREADEFYNSSFDIYKFRSILDAFYSNNGDIIIFPEYYLPIDKLSEVKGIIRESREANKVYIIPLSQVNLSELKQLNEVHGVVLEEIYGEACGKDIYFNLALILIKDQRDSLRIFSQIKTLPSYWETEPHRNTYRAAYLYIFNIGGVVSFSVPICFSFVGKEYSNKSILEPLIPFIEKGKVDCLFVPQWNPKPFHPAFIEAINYICDISDGNTSILLVNVANGFGHSSIVDLFTKKVLTNQYDVRELDDPRYKHLIFVSISERLFKYKYVPNRLRKDKRSPNYVREILIDVFAFDTEWRTQDRRIVDEYRPRRKPILFSPEKYELPDRPDGWVDYICSLSREKLLSYIDDWEGLIGSVFLLTQFALELESEQMLKPTDLVWIIKLVGEYHHLKECHEAAFYFYDKMYDIAHRIRSNRAKLISKYLLMRVYVQSDNKRKQYSALKIAKQFEEIANDRPEILNELGAFSPIILGESALLISHFSNKYESMYEMYKYGSYSAALESIHYNREESGKQKVVSRLLVKAGQEIENCGLEETSPCYLHYLDIRGLTDIVFVRPENAWRSIQLINKYEPQRLGFSGQYLATKHNESLLKHIYGKKAEAERMYLELLQEQREYHGSSSSITAENLSNLLDEEELGAYLLRAVDYGRPYRGHKNISRKKAAKVYGFGKQALRDMPLR